MRSRACRQTRARIRGIVLEAPVSRRQPDPWLDHLRQCPSCRHYYDLVMTIERQLEQGVEVTRRPATAEIELVGQSLAEPARRSRGPFALDRFPGRLGLGLAGASAILLLSIWWSTRPGLEQWTTRDGATALFQVRAFCETTDLAGQPLIRSLSDDPSPQEMSSCPEDGSVRLAYLAERSGFAAAWRRDAPSDTWERLEPAGEGWPAPACRSLSPLPFLVSGETLESMIRLELVLVWTEQPLSSDALETLAKTDGRTPPFDPGIFVRRISIPIDPVQGKGE